MPVHDLDKHFFQVGFNQFDFFERVVAEVPVLRLYLPTDFSALSASREAVLADLQSHSCTRR